MNCFLLSNQILRSQVTFSIVTCQNNVALEQWSSSKWRWYCYIIWSIRELHLYKVKIFPFVYHYTYSLLHTTINIETLYKSGNTNFNITCLDASMFFPFKCILYYQNFNRRCKFLAIPKKKLKNVVVFNNIKFLTENKAVLHNFFKYCLYTL